MPERYQNYYDAAVKCQNQIRHVATKESLHQRYYVVLEELRREAIKQMQSNSHSALSEPPNAQLAVPSMVPSATQEQHTVTEETVFGQPLNTSLSDGNNCQMMSDGTVFGGSPSSLMAEMTSWGEFASLVSAHTKIRSTRY